MTTGKWTAISSGVKQMGMKITNLAEVTHMFQMVDREVNSQTREVFKEYVDKICETAKEFAPVDEHRLERAIHVQPIRSNQYSMKAIIDVSGTIDGRDVSRYATIVHEYEWHRRGPKTRAKSNRAGPRYLTRAMREHEKEMIRALGVAMGKAINRSVARSGVNRRKRSRSRR